MGFDLSQTVAGHTENSAQLGSFARDKRSQLVTKGQMLLNGYSKECSAGIAQAIGESIYWMVHVQENFGDRADVNHGLEKAKHRSKVTSTLDYGGGSDRIQGHIGYSRQHDEPKRNEHRCVHGRSDSARIVSIPAAAEVSSIQRLIPFRGLIPWKAAGREAFRFLPRRGLGRTNRPVWVRICFGLDSISG